MVKDFEPQISIVKYTLVGFQQIAIIAIISRVNIASATEIRVRFTLGPNQRLQNMLFCGSF